MQVYFIKKKDINICFLAIFKIAVYLWSTTSVILYTNNYELQHRFEFTLT